MPEAQSSSRPPIKPSTKVADVIQQYPATLEVFLEMGFEPLRSPIARKTVAKLFTLRQAASFRGMDVDELVVALRRAAGLPEDASMAASGERPAACQAGVVPDLEGDLRVMGLVPCPVRGPLVERFDSRIQELTAASGLQIAWWLAGEGPATVDFRRWMEDRVKRAALEALPDVLVAVGTELFLQQRFGALATGDFFGEFPGHREPRPEFGGLEDPRGRLGLQFCVAFSLSCWPDRLPAEPPKTWADLAKPDFEGHVGLPALHLPIIPDLLATLHDHLGDELFAQFARNVAASMHPVQAVSRGGRGDVPGVVILPDHFANGAQIQGAAHVVPDDGVVLLPAYVAVRAGARKEATDIATFLCSPPFLEPLWEFGRFLPNHRQVDMTLPSSHLIMRPLDRYPADPEEEANRLLAMLSTEKTP